MVREPHHDSFDINATINGEVVEISVEDTGIGIAGDKLDVIFQSFRQEDSGIVRTFGGTGLGLTISKTLIELHGGTIAVHSTKGLGSQFNFTTPKADIAHESVIIDQPIAMITNNLSLESSLEGSNIQSIQGKRGRILAVDDDPVILHVLVNYLT